MSPGADHTELNAISTATRLLGDRWSLLIVSELMRGNSRFSQIVEALPGLSRGLLATRLGYLTRIGIVRRSATDGSDRRAKHLYVLTEAGAALKPALEELSAWASTWSPAEVTTPAGLVHMDLHHLRARLDRAALPTERMQIQFVLLDARPAWLWIDSARTEARHGIAERPSDVVVRSSLATLEDLYWRRQTCRDAVARRHISIEGPLAQAEAFATWFPVRSPPIPRAT